MGFFFVFGPGWYHPPSACAPSPIFQILGGGEEGEIEFLPKLAAPALHSAARSRGGHWKRGSDVTHRGSFQARAVSPCVRLGIKDTSNRPPPPPRPLLLCGRGTQRELSISSAREDPASAANAAFCQDLD